MLIRILLFLSLAPSLTLAGNTIEEISQRCAPAQKDEKILYSSDFKWGYNPLEMIQKALDVYSSPKRLGRRAYWDAEKEKIFFPYEKDHGGAVEVSLDLIKTVAHQVERAFENKYIDAVFFPDMGHSHFLVPEKIMEQKYQSIPVENFSTLYREMLRDPEIKILYHTAEQLQVLDENKELLPDPHLQWRFRTRNLVGQNNPQSDLEILQNPESNANTVHGVSGYFWWGSGFNISANEKGCFEYRNQGQSFYFDLSLYDLEADLTSPSSQEVAF